MNFIYRILFIVLHFVYSFAFCFYSVVSAVVVGVSVSHFEPIEIRLNVFDSLSLTLSPLFFMCPIADVLFFSLES